MSKKTLMYPEKDRQQQEKQIPEACLEPFKHTLNTAKKSDILHNGTQEAALGISGKQATPFQHGSPIKFPKKTKLLQAYPSDEISSLDLIDHKSFTTTADWKIDGSLSPFGAPAHSPQTLQTLAHLLGTDEAKHQLTKVVIPGDRENDCTTYLIGQEDQKEMDFQAKADESGRTRAEEQAEFLKSKATVNEAQVTTAGPHTFRILAEAFLGETFDYKVDKLKKAFQVRGEEWELKHKEDINKLSALLLYRILNLKAEIGEEKAHLKRSKGKFRHFLSGFNGPIKEAKAQEGKIATLLKKMQDSAERKDRELQEMEDQIRNLQGQADEKMQNLRGASISPYNNPEVKRLGSEIKVKEAAKEQAELSAERYVAMDLADIIQLMEEEMSILKSSSQKVVKQTAESTSTVVEEVLHETA